MGNNYGGFDARKELLDRPDEWVAAYKLGNKWMKVGFRTKLMYPVTTSRWELSIDEVVPQAFYDEIDACIPIEDVPLEERWETPVYERPPNTI